MKRQDWMGRTSIHPGRAGPMLLVTRKVSLWGRWVLRCGCKGEGGGGRGGRREQGAV